MKSDYVGRKNGKDVGSVCSQSRPGANTSGGCGSSDLVPPVLAQYQYWICEVARCHKFISPQFAAFDCSRTVKPSRVSSFRFFLSTAATFAPLKLYFPGKNICVYLDQRDVTQKFFSNN